MAYPPIPHGPVVGGALLVKAAEVARPCPLARGARAAYRSAPGVAPALQSLAGRLRVSVADPPLGSDVDVPAVHSAVAVAAAVILSVRRLVEALHVVIIGEGGTGKEPDDGATERRAGDEEGGGGGRPHCSSRCCRDRDGGEGKERNRSVLQIFRYTVVLTILL